jgi:hypothetical protein
VILIWVVLKDLEEITYPAPPATGAEDVDIGPPAVNLARQEVATRVIQNFRRRLLKQRVLEVAVQSEVEYLDGVKELFKDTEEERERMIVGEAREEVMPIVL